MTTAHRPTFDPARGKDAARGPAYHQRLLPAHKTLKFRQRTQGGEGETRGRDFRAELLRAERRALAEKEGREYESEEEVEEVTTADASTKTLTDGRAGGRKRSLDEAGGDGAADEESYEAKKARVLAETADIDASSASGSDRDEEDDDGDDDSSDSDSDDEDEDALLQAELAKIKRERAEAAAREAADKAARDEEQRVEDIARGNPLLNPARPDEYGVKRRWDDDVVFKNQARGTSEREKGRSKEFVNDLLRSDFHRKFMSRYVR